MKLIRMKKILIEKSFILNDNISAILVERTLST